MWVRLSGGMVQAVVEGDHCREDVTGGWVAWGRAASAACCACCRQERCKCGCTCCAAPHRLPAPIEPIRTACPAWPTAPGQHAPNPCCLVCSLSCLAQAAEPVLSCLFPFLLGAGGCVVSLGSVGRNVAAGMTGGLGYFYDEEGEPLGWREPFGWWEHFGWWEPWVPVGASVAGGSIACQVVAVFGGCCVCVCCVHLWPLCSAERQSAAATFPAP